MSFYYSVFVRICLLYLLVGKPPSLRLLNECKPFQRPIGSNVQLLVFLDILIRFDLEDYDWLRFWNGALPHGFWRKPR